MVDVALQVHQRGLLLQHAVPVARGNGVHELMHIGVALADVHIVPNSDHISHEGDHVGGFPDGFAMGDLAFALVQILHFQAQQIAGGGEGEAGTGGVIPEQGDAQTGLENLGGDIVLTHIAQGVGHGEDGFQLVVGLFPGQEKVAIVHILEIQGVQLVNIGLQSLIHD